MKRAFIIHGWEGYPEEGWFPWLKNELEKKGFIVQVPSMPHSSEPTINDWVSYLDKIVGKPNKDTYFIGHSIGCQTIMRYLESLPKNVKVKGAVFVAGWFTLMNLETKEEKLIAEPWLNKPIDYNKIKDHTKSFITILSDDDPVVPLNNKDLFKQRLNSKIIIEKNKEHFSGSDEVKKLQSALDAVLSL